MSLLKSKIVARTKDKEQTRRLGTGAPFGDKHDQIIVSPNGGVGVYIGSFPNGHVRPKFLR